MKPERTFSQTEINDYLRSKIERLVKAYKEAEADECPLYPSNEIYGKMMAILDVSTIFADHDSWMYVQNEIRKALGMECI